MPRYVWIFLIGAGLLAGRFMGEAEALRDEVRELRRTCSPRGDRAPAGLPGAPEPIFEQDLGPLPL